MKRFSPLTFIIILFLLLLNKSTQAQTASVDSLLMKALVTDELLPILIDSAIRNSANIRRDASNEKYANANLQINKKAIFSALSLQSSYNYGTNYSAVNNQSSPIGGSNLTTAQTGFYNVGAGIQIPITYIINRKNIIRAGQSLVNMATADKENTTLSVRQEVIRLYQDFKLSKKLMNISSKNKESAKVNSSMVEKNFLNGQVTVDVVSAILEIYNKSLIEFETYVNRFQTSYMQLEAFTGVDLSSIIMRVK